MQSGLRQQLLTLFVLPVLFCSGPCSTEPGFVYHAPDLPLHRAAEAGDAEAVQRLLDAGEDPCAWDGLGLTALHLSAMKGHLPVAELLVERGVEVDVRARDGSTPLFHASGACHPEVVCFLLAKGADVNAANYNGRTPLHFAAMGGSVEVTQVLLEHGAVVEATSVVGETPLHEAGTNGNTGVARLLIASGAEVDAEDRSGNTALIKACESCLFGRGQAVGLLLASGADVNHANEDGDTPLWCALGGADLKTVKMLVASGGIARERDAYGRTQLMEAVIRGKPDVVELLLDRGADVNAVDNWEGFSVLDHALVNGRRETAAILREHGAKARCVEVGAFGLVTRYPPAWDPPAPPNARETAP